jgi:CRP-like cAMP-binding protein
MSTPLPENRLLAALPPPELARLTPRMTDVTFGHKDLLYRAGGPISHVYFPRSGVLSAVVVMLDGQVAETAATGWEGMVGAAAGLGGTTSPEQVFCQVPPVEARKMPAAEFAAEVARGGALRDVVHAYVCGTLAASAWQAACNCVHLVVERCARLLLACNYRFGADEFPLTN